MSEQRHRILYVNHVSQVSGAEKGLIDLVALLDRRRFEPLVVAPGVGPLSQRLVECGADVLPLSLRRIKRTRAPWTLAGYAMNVVNVALRLAVAARRRNVVLIHANSNTAQIYAGFAGRISGIPCVWHSRDLVPLGGLGRRLYALSKRVIAISSAVQEHLQSYGHGKTILIPNGVNLEAFGKTTSEQRQAARRELGATDDAFLVAMAAQMVPWKNHALFLDAAEQLARHNPRIRFVIVGDDLFGDHREYLTQTRESVARMGLKDRVVFAGYRADMPDLMAAIDLLVHPAAREPFGRVLIEAMAAGKPVVAIDDAGPREVVAHGVTGFLTPAGDAEALARAIGELACDPAKAMRFGVAGRQRASERFDVRENVSRIQNLYAEIIENR